MIEKNRCAILQNVFTATLHLLWIKPVIDRRLVAGKASSERALGNHVIHGHAEQFHAHHAREAQGMTEVVWMRLVPKV